MARKLGARSQSLSIMATLGASLSTMWPSRAQRASNDAPNIAGVPTHTTYPESTGASHFSWSGGSAAAGHPIDEVDPEFDGEQGTGARFRPAAARTLEPAPDDPHAGSRHPVDSKSAPPARTPEGSEYSACADRTPSSIQIAATRTSETNGPIVGEAIDHEEHQPVRRRRDLPARQDSGHQTGHVSARAGARLSCLVRSTEPRWERGQRPDGKVRCRSPQQIIERIVRKFRCARRRASHGGQLAARTPCIDATPPVDINILHYAVKAYWAKRRTRHISSYFLMVCFDTTPTSVNP